jgi:diaminopimelate epimerase
MAERFFKYHGLGNDFVLLDRRESAVDIDAPKAIQLCDRHLGIGADGVLVLLPSHRARARMVVHNADGSIAEMCGNGIRCAAQYLAERAGPSSGESSRPREDGAERVEIDTGAGLLSCLIHRAGRAVPEVEVSMGSAQLLDPSLPSGKTGKAFANQALAGFPGVRGTAVSLGNPHLVLFDSPLDQAPSLGPQIERHPAFPNRTNVEFARIEPDHVQILVWERGVGLTQACGTGACAVVAAGVHDGRLAPDRWHQVQLPGGSLHIRSSADLSSLQMRGPVSFVFEGEI